MRQEVSDLMRRQIVLIPLSSVHICQQLAENGQVAGICEFEALSLECAAGVVVRCGPWGSDVFRGSNGTASLGIDGDWLIPYRVLFCCIQSIYPHSVFMCFVWI